MWPSELLWPWQMQMNRACIPFDKNQGSLIDGNFTNLQGHFSNLQDELSMPNFYHSQYRLRYNPLKAH